MKSIVTRGVIISRRNYREADRILTIYSEKLGKISVLAKGVRKSNSKLGGFLELFNITRLELEEGKNWYILTGVQVENSFNNIRLNLPKISAGYYLAELISRLTGEDDANRHLFKVIENGFETLNRSTKDIIVCAFAWELINKSGFHPELYLCVICKKKLDSGELVFSAAKGGLLDDCTVAPDSILVQPDTVKLIRVAINNLALFQKIKVPPPIVQEFNLVTKKYISEVVEREIKSDKFVETVKGLI